MTGPFRFADELGPEKVIEIAEPRSGLRAVVVLDNTACGPAIGGCRMAPDASVGECVRLARAMTFKTAAAGLAHGGGTAVILADPAIGPAATERLLRAFARAIGEIGNYLVGPDMGTNERAMAVIHDEIGRAVGLPRELGGIAPDEIGATGRGLAVAAEVAAEAAGVGLRGARLAVQGYGAVGRRAARFLVERGAVLVAASDSRGGAAAATGLSLDELDALKAAGRSVAEARGADRIGPGAVIGADCDILVPAARTDVITGENTASVRARILLEGADCAASAEAECRLDALGVLVVPDFIGNAGGVIAAAVEHRGGTEAEAVAAIRETIARNTALTLERARTDGTTPRAAAVAMAGARVRRAMAWRR